MKQVVFAVLLMAMASLTGCLNGDDSPVDENIDTTDDSTSDTTEDNSDTTEDTKDDELIGPVGTNGGYTPPETANVTFYRWGENNGYFHTDWISKNSTTIKTSCMINADTDRPLMIYDSDDRIIYVAIDSRTHGASSCSAGGYGGLKLDITFGPEPVKIAQYSYQNTDVFLWVLVF